MSNITDVYYQTANRQFVENDYGKSQWVQVCGEKELNGATAHFWCAMLDVNKLELAFRNHSWDVSIRHGGPGFEGVDEDYVYRKSLLEEGFEHLLYYRDFYGVKKSFVELSQEFVLINNLYFDKQKNLYYAMLEDGTMEETVRVEGEGNFYIKLSYLMRYAAAKQMAVMLFYDISTHFETDITSLGVKDFIEEYKNETVFYKVWGGDLPGLKSKAFSILMGKKILYPRPVETCGYWPYEKKQEYIEFIVGVDENGNEKTFTCNPDKLDNCFGSNPDAPNYMTPVFFKREVLQKYILHPDIYTICDGRLECQELWSVPIDNHHKESISVYLGDLGQYLPESERLYWKSFNIASDENVSDTAFQRDFLNVWAESEMIEHRFKQHYIETDNAWQERFGWPLFLPLTEDDQYSFDLLRSPLTDSQDEFDRLVLLLVKVLIDSLNEDKIRKSITTEKHTKGIGKLEKWLQSSGYAGFESHIKFLRELQELRSQGTGHRKGSGYEKIASSFGVGEKRLQEVFDDILSAADSFLQYMFQIAKQSPTTSNDIIST